MRKHTLNNRDELQTFQQLFRWIITWSSTKIGLMAAVIKSSNFIFQMTFFRLCRNYAHFDTQMDILQVEKASVQIYRTTHLKYNHLEFLVKHHSSSEGNQIEPKLTSSFSISLVSGSTSMSSWSRAETCTGWENTVVLGCFDKTDPVNHVRHHQLLENIDNS